MPLILQKIAELHLANSNRRRGNSVQRTKLRTQNEYAFPFWDSASHYNSEILMTIMTMTILTILSTFLG